MAGRVQQYRAELQKSNLGKARMSALGNTWLTKMKLATPLPFRGEGRENSYASGTFAKPRPAPVAVLLARTTLPVVPAWM